MIISKDIAVWLKSINTAPMIASKLFNKRHGFLQGREETETSVSEPGAIINTKTTGNKR